MSEWSCATGDNPCPDCRRARAALRATFAFTSVAILALLAWACLRW